MYVLRMEQDGWAEVSTCTEGALAHETPASAVATKWVARENGTAVICVSIALWANVPVGVQLAQRGETVDAPGQIIHVCPGVEHSKRRRAGPKSGSQVCDT